MEAGLMAVAEWEREQGAIDPLDLRKAAELSDLDARLFGTQDRERRSPTG